MTQLFWIKQITIALLSLLFLIFGVHLFLAAYGMKNPLEFIMTFFGSNLIILISLVGLIYPAVKIYLYLRDLKPQHHE